MDEVPDGRWAHVEGVSLEGACFEGPAGLAVSALTGRSYRGGLVVIRGSRPTSRPRRRLRQQLL